MIVPAYRQTRFRLSVPMQREPIISQACSALQGLASEGLSDISTFKYLMLEFFFSFFLFFRGACVRFTSLSHGQINFTHSKFLRAERTLRLLLWTREKKKMSGVFLWSDRWKEYLRRSSPSSPSPGRKYKAVEGGRKKLIENLNPSLSYDTPEIRDAGASEPVNRSRKGNTRSRKRAEKTEAPGREVEQPSISMNPGLSYDNPEMCICS